MSEIDKTNDQKPEEKKKISLAEAMKQKLESQKQQQAKGGNNQNFAQGKKMQSQHTKKSTMHRRTGGQ